ncbi:hypothetical protein [Methanobacterium petrolearium]|uniref:DUF7847 domain-containing protein n=1 Tax=Methanobacterium petrolearium TaxID=710190 RepID=UPI001AE8DD15|nr:hypothetical protein [Methanobacterium petrolearium]MBP1944954.1 hypothetical protein [Methanobacterium petrolearium]BDZ70272.1 hypothetical protein GCM10025861_07890 [Methanobacterium petrolearium]
MDIGDYYSRSFNGFTKNPKLALPTLLGYLVIYGINVVMMAIFIFGTLGTDFLTNVTTGNFNPNSVDFANLMQSFLIFYGVIAIVSFVVSSYMSAATIGMSKSIINGEMPDLGVGFKNGNKYFLKIIAVSIIIGVILGLSFIFAVGGILIDQAYGLFPILTIIGILLTLILWIITLLFIFANQAIVAGDKSVFASLKDSYKLFRENIFDVIVVLIINFILMICIITVLTFINMFLSIIPILGSILGLILVIIAYSIIFPYFALVLTYLYMDKKELIPSEPEHVSSDQEYVE